MIDVAANNTNSVLAERALTQGKLNHPLAVMDFELAVATPDVEVRVWVEMETEMNVSLIELISNPDRL
jgi:hypothetical protein